MAKTKCEELQQEQITAAEKGSGVKVINATIKMAAQAANDLIEIGTIKKGERFLYGTITVSYSTGSATLAIGNETTADKYKAAAAHTTTDVPSMFGKTAAQAVATADEVIWVKVAAASMPSASDGREVKITMFVSTNN